MQLYKQVLENKEITVCADFRELTPLEKVQRFIKDNKETWLDGFQSIDDSGIFRVPIPDFFDVLQVLLICIPISEYLPKIVLLGIKFQYAHIIVFCPSFNTKMLFILIVSL